MKMHYSKTLRMRSYFCTSVGILVWNGIVLNSVFALLQLHNESVNHVGVKRDLHAEIVNRSRSQRFCCLRHKGSIFRAYRLVFIISRSQEHSDQMWGRRAGGSLQSKWGFSLPPKVHDTDLIIPRRQPKVGLPSCCWPTFSSCKRRFFQLKRIMQMTKRHWHFMQFRLTLFIIKTGQIFDLFVKVKSSLSSLSGKLPVLYRVIFTPCLALYVLKGMSHHLVLGKFQF